MAMKINNLKPQKESLIKLDSRKRVKNEFDIRFVLEDL